MPEVQAGDGDVVALGDVHQHLEGRHHRDLVLQTLRRDVADRCLVLVDVCADHLALLIQERPVVEDKEPPVSTLHPPTHWVVLQGFLESQLLPEREKNELECKSDLPSTVVTFAMRAYSATQEW